MRMRSLVVLGFAAGLLAAALAVWASAPVPEFSPQAWRPEPPRPLTPNDRLDTAVTVGTEGLAGPEDIAVDERGRIYAGVRDGWIMRADLNDDAPSFARFAEVGARPLGLAMGPDGLLYVANHGIGLQSVSADGEVALLLTHAGGTPILFANDLAVDDRGIVYLSDSSSRYNRSTLGTRSTYAVPDFIEGRPFGRVIRFDPATGETDVLAEDLHFPNGIAVARDGRSIIVAESTRYRLTRIWLEGPRAGAAEVFVDRLPGVPDGLTGLGDGRMLLAAYYRSDALDGMVLPSAFMRQLMIRIPDAVWAALDSAGYLMTIDDRTGEFLEQWHGDPDLGLAPSNAVIRDGAIYMGTLSGDRVSRLDLVPPGPTP